MPPSWLMSPRYHTEIIAGHLRLADRSPRNCVRCRTWWTVSAGYPLQLQTLSAVTPKRRSPIVRARHRHPPRDRPIVVDPVWSDVCGCETLCAGNGMAPFRLTCRRGALPQPPDIALITDVEISSRVGLRRKVRPPLTCRFWPVTKQPSVDSQTAASAISSAVPTRPSG